MNSISREIRPTRNRKNQYQANLAPTAVCKARAPGLAVLYQTHSALYIIYILRKSVSALLRAARAALRRLAAFGGRRLVPAFALAR